MNFSGLEDDDSFDLTTFDQYKLEDLDVNQTMESENGNFNVTRYTRCYVVFLRNEKLIRKKKAVRREFKDLAMLIDYLKT